VFQDNPTRESLDLTALVEFPNLVMDAQRVDFGSSLVDTQQRRTLLMTNPGLVPVDFTWTWARQALEEGEPDPTCLQTLLWQNSFSYPHACCHPACINEACSCSHALTSLALPAGKPGQPAPTPLFDILPISGTLAPGQSETAHFSFFAAAGARGSCTALCTINGGPQYSVTVAGEASTIKQSLSAQFIDLGQQPFDKPADREVVLANDGKVPFDFAVNLASLSRPGVVEVSPMKGVIAGGDKQVGGRVATTCSGAQARAATALLYLDAPCMSVGATCQAGLWPLCGGPCSSVSLLPALLLCCVQVLKLRVKAGVPDRVVETVLLEVAHFEPQALQVRRHALLLTSCRIRPASSHNMLSCLSQSVTWSCSISAHPNC
jgi:hypothetical protein